MKDFIGNELALGDFVAFTRPGYRDLTLGKIIKFTPKKIRLSYTSYYGSDETHAIDSTYVVKLNEQDVILFLLRKKAK